MKFTLATLKSVLRNKNCEIKRRSSFDGMTDCVQSIDGVAFFPIDKSDIDFSETHTFGIKGLWLVGSSRDWFRVNEEGNEVEVNNCCGSCVIRFS